MKTRISTEHNISNLATPVSHGVMRFQLNATTLAGATSTPQIIKLTEVATGTHVVVEDAWIEVVTAFDSGTSFDLGDGQFDNAFLQGVSAASTGLKKEQATKGVLLTNNSTAIVTDALTLRVNASTAIPQQTSSGSAILHIAYKEMYADTPFSDITSTTAEVAKGNGTIPTFNSGIAVAGTTGQIQYHDGTGNLAAYTPGAARTHLGLELATGDSAAAGGKLLKVSSSGVSSGSLLSIDSSGEIVAGSSSGGVTVAGSSGDVQTNNGSGGLGSIALASGDSAAAGGKLLKVSSSGVSSGSLLSIDSSGEIVAGSLPTQSITQDTYPFGAVEVLSTGVVTSVKSNTHETNNIALTSPGSYALSAYQALPTRSNSYDTNPFYSHYVVTNAEPIVSGISAVKYPDPNGYAEGTTFTVSFAHCNDQFGTGATVFEPPNPFYDRDDSTSTSYNLLNVKQMLGLVPDSGSFTGNPFICADTDHAFYYSGSGTNGYNTTYGFAEYSNECPLFLLSPGGSVTLSVVTAKDASNASKKTWQIIAHYDRYPQYVLTTGTMPYSN